LRGGGKVGRSGLVSKGGKRHLEFKVLKFPEILSKTGWRERRIYGGREK